MSTENTEEPTFPEEDFYEILGISQDAEEKEITEAWRKANNDYRVDRPNRLYKAYIKEKYKRNDKESEGDYDKRIEKEMRNFTAIVINLKKILLDPNQRGKYDKWLKNYGRVPQRNKDGTIKSIYEGWCRFKIPHGKGTRTWKKNDNKYVGEFVRGQMQGQGILTFGNGDIYEGEFFEDKIHGRGTFTNKKDGSVYVGDFVAGKFCGSGIMSEPNKGEYDGKWKDDKKHGEGTFTDLNGIKTTGTWINGQFQKPANSQAQTGSPPPPGGGQSQTTSGPATGSQTQTGSSDPFYKKKAFIPAVLGTIFVIVLSLVFSFKGGDDEKSEKRKSKDTFFAEVDSEKEVLPKRTAEQFQADNERMLSDFREQIKKYEREQSKPPILTEHGNDDSSKLTEAEREAAREELRKMAEEGETEEERIKIKKLNKELDELSKFTEEEVIKRWKIIEEILELGGSINPKDAYMLENPEYYKEMELKRARRLEKLRETPASEFKKTPEKNVQKNTSPIYEGDFNLEGKYHGKGTMTWPSGDVYEGDWVDGYRTGKGTYTWSEGHIYEGDWVNDERTGKGIMTWLEGDIYKGDFVDGEHTGKGIYTLPKDERYEGGVVNGKSHGKGIYTWPDGQRYEGDWVDGERTGKGLMIWPDYHRYEGDFVNGERTGKGIMIWPDGRRYEGDFVNSERTGKGIMTLQDGIVYEGDFVNGIFQNKAIIMTRPAGRKL